MSKFKVIGTIGEGGQAQVKEAIDIESNDVVALKIFRKNQMSLFALNAAHSEHALMKNADH